MDLSLEWAVPVKVAAAVVDDDDADDEESDTCFGGTGGLRCVPGWPMSTKDGSSGSVASTARDRDLGLDNKAGITAVVVVVVV